MIKISKEVFDAIVDRKMAEHDVHHYDERLSNAIVTSTLSELKQQGIIIKQEKT